MKTKNYRLIAMTLIKRLSNGKAKVLPFDSYTLKQVENLAKMIEYKESVKESLDLFDIHLALR
jgi:hypothetical protein